MRSQCKREYESLKWDSREHETYGVKNIARQPGRYAMHIPIYVSSPPTPASAYCYGPANNDGRFSEEKKRLLTCGCAIRISIPWLR